MLSLLVRRLRRQRKPLHNAGRVWAPVCDQESMRRRTSPLYTEHYQQNLQEHASSRNNTRFLSILNPSPTAESFWSGSVVHRFLLKQLQGNWNVPELCCWLKTFCFFLEHACLVSLLCLRSASPFLNKPPTFHNKNSDLLDVDQTREQRSCSTPSGSYQVRLWSRMNECLKDSHQNVEVCLCRRAFFFFYVTHIQQTATAWRFQGEIHLKCRSFFLCSPKIVKFSAPESTDTWFDPQTQLHDTQKSKYLSLTFTVLVLNLSRRWTMFEFMLEWRRGDVLSAASHDSSGDTKENNLCRQFLQLFTQTTLIFTFCLIIFSFYALCQIKTKVINNIVVKKYRFFQCVIFLNCWI